jgi:hypothetical protein
MLSNGTLIIDHVDDSDVGVYHCVGTGPSGPVQTFAAELQLACKCFECALIKKFLESQERIARNPCDFLLLCIQLQPVYKISFHGNRK